MEQNKKVVLGMSGGVDSSAAALLLIEEGYSVHGVTFRLQDELTESVSNALRDISDAQAVCHALSIPHTVLDLRQEFKQNVLDDFSKEYASGRTPNPCIVCNRTIKFAALFNHADRIGAEYIATGHYAKVIKDNETGRYRLKKAAFLPKDQSYVLYTLPSDQLWRVIFPLGEYDKQFARDKVAAAGLSLAKKSESQDICFVPEGDYLSFLKRHTSKEPLPGDFIDDCGNVLGRHKGIWHYTIGQRKGLGLSFAVPHFVSKIDPLTNNITLSLPQKLFSNCLIAAKTFWIEPPDFSKPFLIEAKIRYSHKESPATVCLIDGGDSLKVDFQLPQRAITPGQGVVFYKDDFVIGGATILQSC